MNRKEAIFMFAIVAALLITNTALVQEHTFDCRQPLFSNGSTCSTLGKGCVKPQIKAGVSGLWQHIKVTWHNDTQNPACSIQPDSSATKQNAIQEVESASQ